MEIVSLHQVASQVRRDIVRMVATVNSGHPGGSLGCTDFLTYLYFEGMTHKPDSFNMDGIGEDLFFLSNILFELILFSKRKTLLNFNTFSLKLYAFNERDSKINFSIF